MRPRWQLRAGLAAIPLLGLFLLLRYQFLSTSAPSSSPSRPPLLRTERDDDRLVVVRHEAQHIISEYASVLDTVDPATRIAVTAAAAASAAADAADADSTARATHSASAATTSQQPQTPSLFPADPASVRDRAVRALRPGHVYAHYVPLRYPGDPPTSSCASFNPNAWWRRRRGASWRDGVWRGRGGGDGGAPGGKVRGESGDRSVAGRGAPKKEMRIQVGQRGGGDGGDAATAAPAAAGGRGGGPVKPLTLDEIAIQHMMSVSELKQWNNIVGWDLTNLMAHTMTNTPLTHRKAATPLTTLVTPLLVPTFRQLQTRLPELWSAGLLGLSVLPASLPRGHTCPPPRPRGHRATFCWLPPLPATPCYETASGGRRKERLGLTSRVFSTLRSSEGLLRILTKRAGGAERGGGGCPADEEAAYLVGPSGYEAHLASVRGIDAAIRLPHTYRRILFDKHRTPVNVAEYDFVWAQCGDEYNLHLIAATPRAHLLPAIRRAQRGSFAPRLPSGLEEKEAPARVRGGAENTLDTLNTKDTTDTKDTGDEARAQGDAHEDAEGTMNATPLPFPPRPGRRHTADRPPPSPPPGPRPGPRPGPHRRRPVSFLVIGFDTMSRAHFLRNFPLTSAFLEDAHNSGTHRLTQFLLHNVVARGTVNNMGAFYTGEPASHKTTVSETRNWLWKIMKDEGYATSFIVDTPRETDGDMPRWLVHPPHVDYVLSEPFSVVGHGPGSTAQPYQYALSGSRGRVCLGGKDVHRHAFGYHEAFHDLHRSIPRFSVNWNCAGHEDTMRVTGTYDFDLYTMLKRMYDSGILEDTAVLLLSDHGMKGVTFYETGIGETEYRMPLASLLLPRSVLADHPEYEANIRANQFRLTTHYDLHRTLWHLARFPDPPPPLNADYILAKNNPYVKWDPNPNNPPLRPSRETWPYARSLLEVTMPLNRSCAEAAVPPRWCHCASEMEVIDPKQRTARDLARRALAAIRAKLWGRGEGGGREGARGGGKRWGAGRRWGERGRGGGGGGGGRWDAGRGAWGV